MLEVLFEKLEETSVWDNNELPKIFINYFVFVLASAILK